MRQVGDAVQFYFERNCDLLFDFFGGVSRPLSDDLRVSIGHVGIGFDGQSVKRDDAPDEEDERTSRTRRGFARAKSMALRIIRLVS